MESGSLIRESRWKRPNIYLTIVGVYLLVMSGIIISICGYFIVGPLFYTVPVSGAGGNLAGLAMLLIIIIAIPVVIPAVWGGVALLRNRKGMIPSIIALVFGSIIWFSFFFMSNFLESTRHYVLFSSTGILYDALILLVCLFNIVVLSILIFGWRKIRQISKPSSSQNNSMK